MSDINIELNDYATANTCLGKVASTGKFADKHPMRILVGEDNPFNKMFIDKLFEKFDYTNSHLTENGIEVLKKTRSRRDRSHTYGYSNAGDGWYAGHPAYNREVWR